MFEIQEDHVRKTLIVALTVIVRITNVFHDAKTLKIVKMVNFVPKEDVFLQFAINKVIVDRTTNALLNNVSLDVNIKDNVRMAKTVLITFVPFHQVIICVIYCSIWHSLTEANKLF
jgi:hypothetical protein